MPSFSYKGYDFEVDHVPTEEEFQQMSAHVDTLPPKGIKQPGLETQIPGGEQADIYTPEAPTSLGEKAIGAGETLGSLATGAVAMPAGFAAAGLQKLAHPSDIDFEKQVAANMQRMTYEPRTPAGQAYTETAGKVVNELLPVMGLHGTMPAIRTGEAVNAMKAKFNRPTRTSIGVEELNAKAAPDATIPNLKATEGLNGQQALFDIPEEGRMPNQYEAVTGDWRIDENGMPIKADLSMDVQNAQTPLQRNLWGDELAQKHPQENVANLPQAIDMIPDTPFKGDARETALGRLQGELKAPGELEAAKMEANSPFPPPEEMRVPKKQRGGINVKEIQEGLADLLKEGILKRIGTGMKGVEVYRAVKEGETTSGPREAGNWVTPNKDIAVNVYAKGDASKVVKDYIPARDLYEAHPDGWIYAPHGTDILSMKRTKDMTFGDMLPEQKGMRIPKSQRGGIYFGENKPKQTIEQFSTSLRGSIHEGVKNRELAVKNYLDSGQYKWDKGTTILSPKTGKTYTITGHDINSKTGEPMYWYEGKDGEKGRFFSEKAEEVMKPLTPFNFKKQGGGVLADWSSNKKAESLKGIPGIADRLKDVGDAMIKTPEEAIKLAKDHADVEQNIVQRGFNALTKGGIYLKAKVNNPVVHFVVDRFLKADTLAKAEISDKLHASYLPALRDLSKDERVEVFTLLNAADLNQKVITKDMMNRWGLSDKQQSFMELHNKRMAEVMDKINDARAAIGKKPIAAREAYSSMSMSGDFRKVVTKNGEVVGVIGANSETYGKNSLAKLEAKMKAHDPAYEFGPVQTHGGTRSVKGSPHEAFMDTMKILAEDNPNMKAMLDTLAEIQKDDPSNYMGMQKHTMQKKGVWGMEGRKPWLSAEENARQFFENQTKYMESAYNWAQLTDAAKDANYVMRDEGTIAKQGNAIKLSENYMQNALGLNPSEFGAGLNKSFNALFGGLGIGPSIPKAGLKMTKQVANTALLSLNPMFLGIQLIQPVAAMPGMASMIKSLGAGKSLTFGLADLSKGSITLMKRQLAPGTLTSIERGAFDYAKKNHVYATDMVEHTNQTQKSAGYYTSKITQAPAAAVEQVTRANMYMGLVHMLEDGGLTVKNGLYEQAHRFTDMSMNNYAAIEKPAIYNALGPIGSVAYNLKSYGHNEISRWSMYARELGEQGNAKPILTQMASTIALAGVMGLPFYSQWEEVYNQITKAIGSPRSLALDTMKMSEELGKNLGPKGQYALSHGMFTLAGVDLSKRVGLGDVIPSHASDIAFAGGGKLGGMAKSAYQLATSPSEETAKAAAFNWSPQVLQGPMDVSWYQKGNLAYSKDPMNLKPVAERDATDVLLKKIGLTGIHESVQKTKQYEQKQITKDITDYRSKAMHQIAQDLFRNRELSQKTVDKYFVDGQGDPNTFQKDFQKLVLEQNLAPQQATLLYNAASNRIPQLRALQRQIQ